MKDSVTLREVQLLNVCGVLQTTSGAIHLRFSPGSCSRLSCAKWRVQCGMVTRYPLPPFRKTAKYITCVATPYAQFDNIVRIFSGILGKLIENSLTSGQYLAFSASPTGDDGDLQNRLQNCHGDSQNLANLLPKMMEICRICCQTLRICPEISDTE